MKIERGVYRLADNFVIEMLHITKEFPGIKANDDVTLQLRKGEIHALLGENGAIFLDNAFFRLIQTEQNAHQGLSLIHIWFIPPYCTSRASKRQTKRPPAQR